MDRGEVIAYELCGNVYLNITNRCTSECIFCKKRNLYISVGNNLQCSERSANSISATVERLEPLDEILFGYALRFPSEPVFGRDLRLSREPSIERIINELEEYDLSKYHEVVFTGLGEPTIRLDEVLEITKWLTNNGIQVRLDTNGHAKLIHPEREAAKELSRSGMKKVSISLNAHNEETYIKVCRPKFENSFSSILEFADDVIETGMDLRFTSVNLPIVDINRFQQIAMKFGATFDVRTLF
jgi:cyclic pyranopterin phosphate synthase